MSQNIYAQHIDLTMIVLSAIINIIKGFEKYQYNAFINITKMLHLKKNELCIRGVNEKFK